MSRHETFAVSLVLVAVMSGCENTAQGVKKDTQENAAAAQAAASPAAQKTGAALENAADSIGAAAQDAGAAIKEGAKDLAGAAKDGAQEVKSEVKERDLDDRAKSGARDAGTAVSAAKQTVDVKAALMADASIDASRIDVDSDAGTKTVTLKGSVASAAHKSAAERIAKAKAEGWSVKNQLTVAP